jgi:ribonucleoside-diphosphate reductase alpha chain
MVRLSDNSSKVLQRRYLRKDASGNIIETPEGLFRRVAKAVAAAELKWGKVEPVFWEQKFYRLMSELLFLPNSPTLMNAGTSHSQLSACFVLPVEDNLPGIFSTLKHAALIQQSGGGTGFNFSSLRPKDDMVAEYGGTAAGPVSFMRVFDMTTQHIKQGGKRRGANMGILNIDHPDIDEFIVAKRTSNVLNNFNISVGIPDDFMHALEFNGEWRLIHPNNKKIVKILPAQQLWNDIIESAWQTGDPGLIFLDTINAVNPTPQLGNIESTNPCGEVPLLPYEPCNLGSINLSKVIKQDNGTYTIDWVLLEEIIIIAIRFLDNVIEENNYIIPEIRTMALGNRKIGLGIMGWAELLIQLGIPYDTEEALQLAEQLMEFIQEISLEASKKLAVERGVFPNWEKSIYYPAIPLRNATRTSIAPTGTISILADTSSSIEPLFALAFQREHVLNEETLYSINPLFISYLQAHHLYSEKIKEQLIKEGMAQNMTALPPGTRRLFKTALEISPDWHLQHQLAFQKHTDNAVSKTINLPASATRKEVDEIYRAAWRHKAKGITIFRNRSKVKQVLNAGIKAGENGCKVCTE